MTDADERWGRIAYLAYSTNTGGVSLATGDSLPSWESLASEYRTAWVAAAHEVIANFAPATDPA